MPKMNEYDKSHLPKDLKLEWVYESEVEQTWLLAIPESIARKGEKRVREFAASRKALGLACELDTYEQLEISDNLHLTHHPHLKVSLSHTRGLSAALAATQQRSVGIDIEHAKREFNTEVAKFFVRSDDLELPLLKLWSIKEAAFKAIAPLGLHTDQKEVLVLKDLRVKDSVITLFDKDVATWNCQEHDQIITSVCWC